MKRIYLLSLMLPLALAATEPALYMPLDQSADVLGPNGKIIGKGIIHGANGYQKGVVGQALNVKRQAYDQVTALVLQSKLNTDNGTIAFWFKPNWNEQDGQSHMLFYGSTKSEKKRFYMVKSKNGYLDVSVVGPKQAQVFKPNLFKKDQWAHLAVTWSCEKNLVTLYVNGKKIGTKNTSVPFTRIGKAEDVTIFFGQPGTDRFKTNVGEGLYDEFKFYEKELSADEIFLMATKGAQVRLNDITLQPAVRKGNDLSFMFRSAVGTFAGPHTLLVLKGEKPKNTITFASLGASRKISMSVENSGVVKTVESSYTFDLKNPVRMEIRQRGKELVWLVDDAWQGAVVLTNTFGKIVKAIGADGVEIKAPSMIPEKSELNRLSNTNMNSVEKNLWDLRDAQRVQSGVRSCVSLNGYWRVIPADDYTYAPPAEKWGYQRVPGSFRAPQFKMHAIVKGKLVDAPWYWKGRDLLKYRTGWYQRVFEIPSDLRSGRIYLHFQNVNGDAGRIYLNGKLINEFRQDYANFTVMPNRLRLDVTDLVNKTGKNVLTLYIDRHYVGIWRGSPSIGDHQEIAIGDVWLEKAPSKLSLDSALALPSFRQKKIHLHVRLQNLSGETGKAVVRFDFKRNGKVEKSFKFPVNLAGKSQQVADYFDSWENPVLWDCENPNLYKMTAELEKNDRVIDSLPEQNFGFREAWVENGEIRLNGQKLRLRMWSSPNLMRMRGYYNNEKNLEQYVYHIRELNYNAVRMSPFGKTSHVIWKEYLNASNKVGIYNLQQMLPYVDDEINEYKKQVLRFLEEYGNNPSVLMWYTDFNTCGYAWDQDPAKLNDMTYDPQEKRVPRNRVKVAEKVMRAYDFSRELFQHAGGNSGKIFTSMNYQSMGTPIQEQEDWPKQWSEKHTAPLMVVESAFPFYPQFFHFDKGDRRMMTAEHAARYFGDDVFNKVKGPGYSQGLDGFPPYKDWDPNHRAVAEMIYSRVVPAWRAYDMSGLGDFPGDRDLGQGFRTFGRHNMIYSIENDVKTAGLKPDNKYGWSETQVHPLSDYTKREGIYDTIRKVFEPLLIFLGGNIGDFTNKDHAFFSGESFQKSVVIVNDRTTAQKLSLRWKLVVNGTAVQDGTIDTTVEPGGIQKLPIELTAPEVLKRTEAELQLEAVLGRKLVREDKLALQFFPEHTQAEYYQHTNAGLYDPEGKTEELLKQAKFPFRKVSTIGDIKECRLLIIGKNALKGANPAILKQIDELKLVEKGLKILFFEQKECNLANFVFESPSYRNAFIRCAESPYVAGLKDADFSDWRGSADSVPAFVLSAPNSPHYPRSKWKCGNGGIVSGNVIRKPSYGNFTTIVDCGFNLMFASLMELRKEHGIVLFCQLDVTNRYLKDPVATKVVENILAEMSKPQVPVDPNRVVYYGDAKNEEILKRMGMQYRKVTGVWDANMAETVIFGKDPIDPKQYAKMKNMLQKKAVIMLPGAPLELVPYEFKRGTTQHYQAVLPKNERIFAGITNADLYFRDVHDLPVFEKTPAWLIATAPAVFAKLELGNDVFVFLNLPPDGVKDEMWNREKIARVWSGIFNNMNIGLGKDLQLFTATKSRANSKQFCFGEIPLDNGYLKLDMQNNGKVTDTQGFKPVKLGLSWEALGYQQENPYYKYPANTPKGLKKAYDGYGWYRCEFEVPADWKNHSIRFVGGPIDDSDWCYMNGVKFGETLVEKFENSWSMKRNYVIPNKLIKFGGKNVLMIRVFDRWGSGGVTGPVKIIAEDAKSSDSWSPYIDKLDFYDVDAYHNW